MINKISIVCAFLLLLGCETTSGHPPEEWGNDYIVCTHKYSEETFYYQLESVKLYTDLIHNYPDVVSLTDSNGHIRFYTEEESHNWEGDDCLDTFEEINNEN